MLSALVCADEDFPHHSVKVCGHLLGSDVFKMPTGTMDAAVPLPVSGEPLEVAENSVDFNSETESRVA